MILFNPFVLSALFLYLPKTLEKIPVFWSFQGVEKGCIEIKRVHKGWIKLDFEKSRAFNTTACFMPMITVVQR